MGEQITLQVPFRGNSVEIVADISDHTVSPHSGRELRHAESAVNVGDEASSEFREALAASPATDADGDRWSAQIRRESFSNGGPHELVIDWAESEELQADLVTLEGLELTPSSYEENLDEDGVLAIELQATLSPEETDRVRHLQIDSTQDQQRYWPVARVGISDEPRSMRLGRVLWSKRADGNIEHKITLVDEAHDRDPSASTPFLMMAGEPQLGRTMTGLADLAGQFEALLVLLERANPLARGA